MLLLGAPSSAATVNYLVATYTPGSANFKSVMTNYPAYYEYGCGGGSPGGPAGFYKSDLSTPWVGPSVVTTSLISGLTSATITLSIISTEPPVGAPVHYYGINEKLTASPSGSYYFAGIPASINIKSTQSPSTIQTLVLNGPSITLSGTYSGGSLILPSVLLPDGVALIQYPMSSIVSSALQMTGTWYFSNACAGIRVDNYAPSDPTSSAAISTVIVSNVAPSSYNLTLAGVTCATGVLCNSSGTLTPANAVSISASAGGGIGYSISNAGYVYAGLIGYVIGY